MEEFAISLSKLDKLVLLPIYPAREEPIKGVNSEVLLEKIKIKNKVLVYDKSKINQHLSFSSPHLILTIGAGNIGLEIENIKTHLLSIH